MWYSKRKSWRWWRQERKTWEQRFKTSKQSTVATMYCHCPGSHLLVCFSISLCMSWLIWFTFPFINALINIQTCTTGVLLRKLGALSTWPVRKYHWPVFKSWYEIFQNWPVILIRNLSRVNSLIWLWLYIFNFTTARNLWSKFMVYFINLMSEII